MTGIIDSALLIMSGAERRIETLANNVANIATPGFKRQISFAEVLGGGEGGPAPGMSPVLNHRADLAQGRMTETGNPLDLAISGEGFFQLRDGDRTVFTRDGQFRRADDGRILTQQGQILQQAGGGDLVLDSSEVEILRDGTVLSGGSPVARIALAAPADARSVDAIGGSLFRIPAEGIEEVAEPNLRQGHVEASNVSLGDEMAAMTAALRQAESGARLVTLYDDLLGRAITAFGQVAR
ncbi:MAG: flagellar basal-body rod protein FlgF [Sphingomonadales bacterium]|jgi:flagellar basal-body rod protein FlgG|nr:flagellar basal-body rod protein FlgF [Sphingomonadales bacterium]